MDDASKDRPGVTSPGLNRRARLIGWFLVALIVVVAVEGFAYAAYRIVVLPRAGFLVYTPPESIDSAMYTDYLDRRDALLGWPIANGAHRLP